MDSPCSTGRPARKTDRPFCCCMDFRHRRACSNRSLRGYLIAIIWSLPIIRASDTATDRIESVIVQDAVAHNEGLGENWKARRAFWADRPANESALRTNLLSLAATRARHVGNDP